MWKTIKSDLTNFVLSSPQKVNTSSLNRLRAHRHELCTIVKRFVASQEWCHDRADVVQERRGSRRSSHAVVAQLAEPATTPELLLLRRRSRLEEPNHLKVTALPPLHCRRRQENFAVAARGRGGGHGLEERTPRLLLPENKVAGDTLAATIARRGDRRSRSRCRLRELTILLATHARNRGEKPLLCFDDLHHPPPEIIEKRGEKARSQLYLTESPVPPPTTANVSYRRSSMAAAWSPPAFHGRSLLLELY
nr:hypothetical protein Iba_chr12aCG9590 [Ipomoea batatas]